MATVHRAWDEELQRPVAVKVLAASLGSDPELRARFVREARAAARLSHPNVVAVFDVGDDGGLPYFVMEHVDGGTLEGRGPLPAEEAVALVRQAAAGLAHAHAEGVVHRDVKPGNLLVRSDGTVKVADFGIARAAGDSRLTQAGTILGTAAYLAPEQAVGDHATPATDVYALGSVLYELLTGRPPRTPRTLAELSYDEPLTPVRDLAPSVPPAIEDVVMRCLAADPRYRPQDAGALAAELGGSAPGPTAPTARTARTVVQQRPDPRPPHLRRWVAAAAVLVVVAVAGGVAVAASDSEEAATPRRVQAPARAATPAQDARNVADWIRRLGKS
jgi:serine/threonine protein kinase